MARTERWVAGDFQPGWASTQSPLANGDGVCSPVCVNWTHARARRLLFCFPCHGCVCHPHRTNQCASCRLAGCSTSNRIASSTRPIHVTDDVPFSSSRGRPFASTVAAGDGLHGELTTA